MSGGAADRERQGRDRQMALRQGADIAPDLVVAISARRGVMAERRTYARPEGGVKAPSCRRSG